MYVRKRLIVWPNPFIIVLDMDNTTISPSSLMDRGAKRAWETKAVIIPRQNNNEMNGLFNHHGYEMWRKKIYGGVSIALDGRQSTARREREARNPG